MTVANIMKLLIIPKGKRKTVFCESFVTPSYSEKVVCAVKIIHQMKKDSHERQETDPIAFKLINAII